MRFVFALVVLSLFSVVACNRHPEHASDEIIVEVGGKVLTKSEMKTMLPTGISSGDSIIMAEHFIQTWIRDELLYIVALKNLSNRKEIDQLVENYRKSLIIYQYQDQLVSEKLSKGIDEADLREYYEKNKDKFQTDRPLFKGFFLKIHYYLDLVPLSAVHRSYFNP